MDGGKKKKTGEKKKKLSGKEKAWKRVFFKERNKKSNLENKR